VKELARIKVQQEQISALRSKLITVKNQSSEAYGNVGKAKANLDWQVASRSNIDARLAAVQKRLKKQADLMGKYAGFLNTVNSQFGAKDAELRNKAKFIMYQLAGVTAILSGLPEWMKQPVIHDHYRNNQWGITRIWEIIKESFGVSAIPVASLLVLRDLQNAQTKAAPKKSSSSSKKKAAATASAATIFAAFGSKIEKAAKSVGKAVTKTAQKIGKAVSDTAVTMWDGAKAIYTSKPFSYVKDITLDILSVPKQVLSFTKNVATGNFLGVCSNVVSIVNLPYLLGQDAIAVVMYGIGKGAETFGNQKMAEKAYAIADDYIDRNGLQDELRDMGWDAAADVYGGIKTAADTVDIIKDLGDLTKGGGKVLDAIKNGDKQAIGEGLFDLTGLKRGKEIAGYTGYDSTLKKIAAYGSNIKKADKYITGAFEGKPVETFVGSTDLVKPFIDTKENVGKITEGLHEFGKYVDFVHGR